ncbi:MAG TPA: DinB family protein [Thermoanaerobaculia bacterium]|nr:DinB family protein [Thermoanaerobaculia bacterium]
MSGEARPVGAEGQTGALRTMLKSQYHASLAMLREAIELCPDATWEADGHTNAPWQLAYHALFFAHFYLQPNEAAFRPWPGHQAQVQNPDGIGGPPEPGNPLPVTPDPYSKSQALEYWSFCDALVDSAVDALDLWSPESGFPWYPIPKLEHQLVNLRHIQHHMAQLADRVRATRNLGVRWAGARRAS